MALVLTDSKHYHDIAEAIREKTGSDDTYLPSEMASAIANITGGGGGVGLDNFDVIYDDILALNATSTSGSNVKTITGLKNLLYYPILFFLIENTDLAVTPKKFVRRASLAFNSMYETGQASWSSSSFVQYIREEGSFSTANNGYGYSISNPSKDNELTVWGRASSSYFDSLLGNYRIQVLGLKPFSN